MPTLKNISIPPSLNKMAFDIIKAAIMEFKLLPGTLYSTQVLAKQLGISETPVKNALQELANKGFLTLIPRKGILITTPTVKDVSDLYTIRNALERLVISEVMPKLTDDHIRALDNIYDKGDKFAEQTKNAENNQRAHYITIDREFHDYLATLSGNSYLIKAIADIRDLVDWMGWRALLRDGRTFEVQKEHLKLMRALRKRDVQKAADCMTEHIIITKDNVVRWFNEKGKKKETEKYIRNEGELRP